jgi:tRNA-dihydrouridine synthase C
MADNAAALARLNPPGIDLNFGCPAKVVNRHGGGAALLDEPELVAKIVAAVRRAVPSNIPVSAKMRLGFNDDSRAEECAIAIASSGANELVVHARTKADGYRPPAYWSRIADIKAVVDIRVIANGEIWNVDDAKRCQELSGCDTLMIGRGMVQNPCLANDIKGLAGASSWQSIQPLLHDFWELVCNRLDRKSRTGRFKQWLNFLRRQYPEAEVAYMALRTCNDPDQVDAWFAAFIPAKTALQTH